MPYSRPPGSSKRYPIAPTWIGRNSKTCSRCFTELPISMFGWYVDNRYGTQRPKAACADCSKEKSRGEYARKNSKGKCCRISGCSRSVHSAGLCTMHYRRQQRENYGACKVEGCDRLQQDGGLCPMHRRRLRLFGDVGRPGPARRSGNGWKESRRPYFVKVRTRGGRLDKYRMVPAPESPMANRKGYVLEHRLVMAQALGRPLLHGETVHPKNGNTLDNNLDNLELWVSHQAAGQRPEDHIAYAEEILHLHRRCGYACAQERAGQRSFNGRRSRARSHGRSRRVGS